MTDYAKFVSRAVYSANSDYSDPRVDTRSKNSTLTPDEYLYRQIELSTTAYTIDLGAFASITGIWIRNLDSTNAVWAEFYQQTGTYAAGDLDFSVGPPGTILDNNGGDFTTTPEYGQIGSYVRVASSESAANDGLFLIQEIEDSAATNDLITVRESQTIANNDDDEAATLSFESRQRVEIAASGSFHLVGAIVPAGDLVLQAFAGSPEVEVLIVGS